LQDYGQVQGQSEGTEDEAEAEASKYSWARREVVGVLAANIPLLFVNFTWNLYHLCSQRVYVLLGYSLLHEPEETFSTLGPTSCGKRSGNGTRRGTVATRILYGVDK
jgi:hypothetical protein